MTYGFMQEHPHRLSYLNNSGTIKDTLRRYCGGLPYFTVTDKNVARLHPGILPEKDIYVIEPGEQSKTLENVEKICRAMIEAGMTRDCTVVAVGGGVVGDLTGTVASLYMRGLDFINVPTTLLAQVDSGIGGKTGVNLDGYKNMIGSFYKPIDVVICTELLSTLPEREWRCGMGELIKTALLKEKLFDFVSSNIDKLLHRDNAAVTEAVKQASFYKSQITDVDPYERGHRMQLNLGHTVGHALEKCDDHKLSHGEYVMLGLAIELKMTGCNPEIFAEVVRILKLAGMPKLAAVSAEDITSAAGVDKKNRSDGKITLSGLKRIAEPFFEKLEPADFTVAYRETVDELIKSGALSYA